jgi:hypothetical protein
MSKLSFTLLRTKFMNVIRKKPLVIALVAVALLVASIGATTIPSVDTTTAHSPKTEDHQRELIGAVDVSTGAPQNGRDPASQSQNSLASAASKPEGPGQRVSKPAANVNGSHGHHDAPAKPSGVNSAGCVVGYGKPGEQCLPTPGANKPVTCDYVHSKGFHHGLSVTGDDQFHLDKNHDDIACGHDD